MIRLFPINYLRDIAFKNTRSNLVLFVEGDYIVPRDLRKNLLKRVYLKAFFFLPGLLYFILYIFSPLFLSEPKTLFVTGLFDAKKGVSLSDIPQNKSELISLWNRKGDKLILPRDRGAFREWNHHRWKGTNDIYEIWTSSYFEPYSVAHRTTQFYDETYVTWGVDKVEQVRSLKKLGYKTKVLPEAFVIHLSHDDLDKDYKGWYDGLNDGPRTQMKLGTSDNRKKALPGLLANNYYPHWLWNISNKANNNTNACKESSKVYTLRNSIDATKTNITMLKQTLYCLVVNLVVLCVIVVRVKKGTSKNRITKVTVVAKEGHTS